jgi:hypothetical protein
MRCYGLILSNYFLAMKNQYMFILHFDLADPFRILLPTIECRSEQAAHISFHDSRLLKSEEVSDTSSMILCENSIWLSGASTK